MAVTKEQILAELRRRRAAKQTENKAVRKPIAKAQDSLDAVVTEQTTRTSSPRTITEAIAQRTANFKGETKKIYTTLAENIVNATRTIYSEATQAGPYMGVANTGNAAGVGLVKTYFDIFFGYFPSLIVPEIASVQPIKTEKAMIFYYQTLAGSTKGNVTAGDVLIDAFQVNTDPEYTSNVVTIATNVDVPVWGPVVARSIKIPGQTLTYTNDNTATFKADNVTYNVIITEADNAIKVAITDGDNNPVDTFKKATYEYANKYAPTQVPELNANVDSREITAKARTIKTQYSFQAGFGFEAQFGVTLEDKLSEAAMYELKRETDLDFVFEIMNSAPVLVQWNKAAGVANGLYEFHKLSFLDAIIGASNYIFKISKRARGNVLLVGPNAQTVVETLPAFQGENYGSQLGGARVIGKLKDIKVIAVPELADDDWAVIYKSQNDSLDAGIVFAPYIPVVSTPTVMLDDFMARKAFTTSYGKLVVNPNYFVRGQIINNPIAQPVQILDKNGEVIESFGGADA
jgi:hypothetical protein